MPVLRLGGPAHMTYYQRALVRDNLARVFCLCLEFQAMREAYLEKPGLVNYRLGLYLF
jgi:hypothetical protein